MVVVGRAGGPDVASGRRPGSAGQAVLREGWIPGEGGCSGGQRFADVDLGWGGVGGRVWAGVWEAGAGSFRGWGGDRGGGAGDGPGEFDGGGPRGVFLGDQGWGGRAEDRSGGRSGAVDGGFGFFERGF